MNYFEDIKKHLEFHLSALENIIQRNESSDKFTQHLNRTLLVVNEVSSKKSENHRTVIEYLENESRNFGWSFPENPSEEKSESSFWELKKRIEEIIKSMAINERLSYFGYLEDYEKLAPHERSAKEQIERLLYIK
jgi:hypothetical protein